MLLVATKATGLEAALERVTATPAAGRAAAERTGPHVHARERFGVAVVAAGSIRIEADRPAPGRIVQTSPFLRVDLASADGALRERLERLASRLERADVPATVGDSEAQVMWSKLTRLCALALTTSAYDQPVGTIRTEHRADARRGPR